MMIIHLRASWTFSELLEPFLKLFPGQIDVTGFSNVFLPVCQNPGHEGSYNFFLRSALRDKVQVSCRRRRIFPCGYTPGYCIPILVKIFILIQTPVAVEINRQDAYPFGLRFGLGIIGIVNIVETDAQSIVADCLNQTRIAVNAYALKVFLIFPQVLRPGFRCTAGIGAGIDMNGISILIFTLTILTIAITFTIGNLTPDNLTPAFDRTGNPDACQSFFFDSLRQDIF